MRDTTGHYKRLLELISEAESMERSPYSSYDRVFVWKMSVDSLLSQLLGNSHNYQISFRVAADQIPMSTTAGTVEHDVRRARAVLEALKADLLAGIRFEPDAKEFSAGNSQDQAVLLRVEKLLQEMVQLLRNRG